MTFDFAWLYTPKFYELCQVYRHASIDRQVDVHAAFNALREYIREQVERSVSE